MGTPKRQLDSAVAAINGRYGDQALRKASHLARSVIPPHISTGFAALDALTGCEGLPLNANILLSGQMTSGKLTVAYKALACAQASATKPRTVAILDLTESVMPGYLEGCGVSMDRVLIARPESARMAVDLVLDLVRSRGVAAILVDSLVEIAAEKGGMRYLTSCLGKLDRLLEGSGCLILWIDELDPPWSRLLNRDRAAALRGHAALHLLFQRIRWVHKAKGLAGYQVQVQLLKSRWAQAGATATIRIPLNLTTRA